MSPCFAIQNQWCTHSLTNSKKLMIIYVYCIIKPNHKIISKLVVTVGSLQLNSFKIIKIIKTMQVQQYKKHATFCESTLVYIALHVCSTNIVAYWVGNQWKNNKYTWTGWSNLYIKNCTYKSNQVQAKPLARKKRGVWLQSQDLIGRGQAVSKKCGQWRNRNFATCPHGKSLQVFEFQFWLDVCSVD